MKLPNLDHLEIPEAKLSQYLLNPNHPEGGSKAKFFIECGFGPLEPAVLADAIRRQAKENDVTLVTETPFGTKFIVDGLLATPSQTLANVRVIWFVELGEDNPRLVTCHPLPRIAM